MKKLYYVCLYNHSINVFTRFLVSAEDEPSACKDALASLNNKWKVTITSFVCETPDDLCMEL